MIATAGSSDLVWESLTDGNMDFSPYLVAVVALVILRVLLGVRLRWYIVIGAVVLAPLFQGFAGRVGYPIATAVAILVAAAIVVSRRRSPAG
jgi:hypothetical protein